MLITESKLNRDRYLSLSVSIPCAHKYAPNSFQANRITSEGHSARRRPLVLHRLTPTRPPLVGASSALVVLTAPTTRFAERHTERAVAGVEG